jgi:hypothetical protein
MMNFNQPIRRIPQIFAGLSFVATLFAATTPSHAGEITAISWFSGIGSVAGEFIGPLVDPNNDDVAGPSPNELKITQKAYNAIGPVDLEFTVVPSGGVTEYVMTEGVSNGTGIGWSGYRLELGYGVGSAFSPSPSGDDLDFDAPDFNSGTDFSTFFSTVTETEDVITASGGFFPIGGYSLPPFVFSIDVPDGISAFTIRQVPIPVPEPSTLLIAGIAALSLIVTIRRVAGVGRVAVVERSEPPAA